MRYLSVCSGIEAATVAWHHMGWKPVAFSEIEKFPSAVLAHHYPNVPNWGDMTKFKEWPDANIDVLVGGTPCQSFSVAGLRKGLDDPRGNLMLTFGAIAQRYCPEWLVWENVPGVLSSNGGRDFGAFLGMLAELGYGFAYRILDAQYFGVPQRRRRVFVCAVRGTGNWQRAAAVLFERHSLSGHPAPSRQARKGTAGSIAPGATASGWPADVSPTLNAHFGSKQGLEDQHVHGGGDCLCPPVAMCLITKTRLDSETETLIPTAGGGFDAVAIQGTLIGRGENAGPQGSGADVSGAMFTLTKTDVHAVAMNIYGGNKRTDRPEGGFYVRMDEDTSKTLDAASGLNPTCSQGGTAVMHPVAFGVGEQPDVGHCLRSGASKADKHESTTYVAQPYIGGVDYENNAHGMDEATGPLLKGSPTGGGRPLPAIATAMQVRRLTPVECERLQGFPDGYTNIPWRGKPESPDGPRYKALGNSMAVPCMVWIGERINEVSKL